MIEELATSMSSKILKVKHNLSSFFIFHSAKLAMTNIVMKSYICTFIYILNKNELYIHTSTFSSSKSGNFIQYFVKMVHGKAIYNSQILALS